MIPPCGKLSNKDKGELKRVYERGVDDFEKGYKYISDRLPEVQIDLSHCATEEHTYLSIATTILFDMLSSWRERPKRYKKRLLDQMLFAIYFVMHFKILSGG